MAKTKERIKRNTIHESQLGGNDSELSGKFSPHFSFSLLSRYKSAKENTRIISRFKNSKLDFHGVSDVPI